MEQRMKQHQLRLVRSLVGACGVLWMIAAGDGAFAQQTVKAAATAAAVARPAAKATAEEEEPGAAKPSKRGGEGIKLHGHWVLQVRNADGTLGQRREFDNSLVTTYAALFNSPLSSSGSGLLAGVLSGNLAVGNPAIGLISGPVGNGNNGTPDVWCNPGVGGSALVPNLECYVFTSTNSLWNGSPVAGSDLGGTTLGLNISVSFTPNVTLTMTGNYTVPPSLFEIDAVQSLYGVCAPKSSAYISALANGSNPNLYYLTGSNYTVRTADVAPTNCTASNMANSTTDVPLLGALTSTVVSSNGAASPLTVTNGQIVTVTLTLSFS